jgi:hypothetical protein
MSDDKKKRLVSLLNEKTRAKEIEWERGKSDGEFVANVGQNVVKLKQGVDPFSQGIATDYIVMLVNAEGKVGESFTDVDLDVGEGTKAWHGVLSDLYAEARRSALHSDALIDSILDELGE